VRGGDKGEAWVLFAPVSTLQYCMNARQSGPAVPVPASSVEPSQAALRA
jgi:hypothetical protein